MITKRQRMVLTPLNFGVTPSKEIEESIQVLNPSIRSGFSPLFERNNSFSFKVYRSYSDRERIISRHAIINNNSFNQNKHQQEERKYQIKKIGEIEELLKNMFNNNIEEIDTQDFNKDHLQILKIILKRKYLKSNEVKNKLNEITVETGPELLKDLCRLINKISSDKRKEEMVKFCFKQVLKKLKSRFERKSGEEYNNQVFWLYYFQLEITNNEIPIKMLFDPLKRSRFSNPYFKSLKGEYLRLLFNNNRFKADFFDILNNDLKAKYQRGVRHKLKHKTKSLKDAIMKSHPIEFSHVYKEFISKLNSSKDMKLPWSSVEIDEAINVFKGRIKKILD